MVSRICLIILVLSLLSCDKGSDDKVGQVVSKDPVLTNMIPEKPVKIQLKRNYKGEYSWDIKGDDVSRIIEADKDLRNSIEGNKKEE